MHKKNTKNVFFTTFFSYKLYVEEVFSTYIRISKKKKVATKQEFYDETFRMVILKIL